MLRVIRYFALGGLLLTLGASCVSKKKYLAIQASNETLHGKLDECNRSLSSCMGDKSVMEARIAELQNKNEHLVDQVA